MRLNHQVDEKNVKKTNIQVVCLEFALLRIVKILASPFSLFLVLL